MKEKGPYKVLSSREIYKNPWILVREDKVIHPGGKEGIFGIIEMTHGISVLPVNSEKEVFLIKEYRYGAEKEVLSLIGGTVENSDTELRTAKRELKEETGLEATKWVKLGDFNAYENVVKSKKIPLYLENNDSYSFFKKYGGLIKTGPTHTNLMDIGLIIKY